MQQVTDNNPPPRPARSNRERINSGDSGQLSETELLAILFQRGQREDDALELASRLLASFGGLRPLLMAKGSDIVRIDGVGEARLAVLQALPEIARRYFEASLVFTESLRSPLDTERFLRAKLRDLPHEVFCCLYLDNRHRVLRFAELFRGTIDGTSVYPREVVKEALACNAAAVIVAHNHPSGVAEPSQADERITHRLKAALELVDIRLLDHLIVGDGASTSLASRGMV